MLARLADAYPKTPAVVRLKAAILFAGVQYDPCLAEAADWAFPNYMPYHLPPGVPAFRGKRLIQMPYLLRMADDTQVRLRIKPDSPFSIRKADNPLGYALYEDDRFITATSFERRYPWADLLTGDGTPMRATGLSQHGDMLVLNVAPGCEYFVVPDANGKTQNKSCSFCLYGLPDKQRMEPLGQELYVAQTPRPTLERVREACTHPETHARHLYLVGGSMLDMKAEGDRFVGIARHLAEKGLHERYYIACGSGAIPRESMIELKDAGVRGACFNLEVWDPTQFKRVCPGKDSIVGRDRWIESLQDAVDVFGDEHVMTAFVGGAEMDGPGAQSPEAALASNIEAAETLIPQGIQTIYSLHWKMTGKQRGMEPLYTLDFFLKLNEAMAELRASHQRPINEDFFCRRCAYMQLEPDYDYWRRATLPAVHDAGVTALV